MIYILECWMYCMLQSGFRPGHSTEIAAVLRVMSDLLEAVDSGDVAALVRLDLSAAFDTVDHSILCRRLQPCRSPLDWMAQFWPGSIHIFTVGHSASHV